MTKSVLTLTISFLMVQISSAQQSIGFSDSTNFQYIIDYRLPDWGYSNFYISAGGLSYDGNYYTSNRTSINPNETTYIDQESSDNDIAFQVSPAFQLYKQSEKRVLSFDTEIRIGAEYYKGKDTSEGYSSNEEIEVVGQKQTNKQSESNLGYSVNLNYKKYLASNFFLATGGDTYLNFSESHSESGRSQGNSSLTNRTSDSYNRNFRIRPKFGIGFGRLRNVVPQLRALRLQERYHKIEDNTFNFSETVGAAEQFTKIQGYRGIYDRHEKYFWGDMNEILSEKLDAINAYELMYLTDVLNENLGLRLEGFEVSLLAQYNHRSSLRKTESTENGVDDNNRSFNKDKSILTIANILWYKNLSLNHQLSFNFSNQIDLPLKKSDYEKWRFNSVANFSWLFTITDRYLLTTSLRSYYDTQEFKDRFSESDQFRNQTYLSSSLSYFIENKMSLTGSISTGYITRSNKDPDSNFNSKNFTWNFSVSVRYYFDRNLY